MNVSTPVSSSLGVVLRPRAHGEFPLRHVALDGRQLSFGNREGDVDGLELIDGHQLLAVGHHHVALFHSDVAGAAVDGRTDAGVAELHARIIHGRLAGPDVGGRAFNSRLVRG
jgi:hypothetical protein